MNRKLLFLMLFLGLSSVVSHHALAGCKKAITVTSNISGTFASMASVQAIAHTTVSRAKREWETVSRKTYGEAFSYSARGTCDCKAIIRKPVKGEKVTIRCKLTAQPCDHNYYFLEPFKCYFR